MSSTTTRSRSAPDLDAQVATLAELLRTSRHVVFCTGAGISTNAPANLRDYRGPDGIWTEAQAAGLVVGEPGEKGMPVDCPWDASMYRRIPAARPTLAHRVIAQLAAGAEPFVQHVITQNEDGLHRRSGLDAARLSELHGSAYVELCGKYTTDDSDSDVNDSSDDDSSSSGGCSAANKAANAAARARRPAGCGRAITREFVTYWPETYKRSWALGRHITGRQCPTCRGGELTAAAAEEAARAHAAASEAAEAAEAADAAVGNGGAAAADGLEGRGWLADSTVDFGECPAAPDPDHPPHPSSEPLRPTPHPHPDPGECPSGFPWGAENPVHNLAAAKEAMRRADLVVAWGTSLSILANYFDPWHKDSKWALPPPKGLRLATAVEESAATASKGSRGGGGASVHKRPRRRTAVRPCQLVIINKGPTLDEELAALKIEHDVDATAAALVRHLGLPPPPPYDPRADPLLADALAPEPGEPRAPWTITAALEEASAVGGE